MRALQGRAAVVTGGSRGIGAAVVRRLGADGATVVFSYRGDPDAAGRVAQDVADAGGHATAVRADAADLTQVASLFTAADEVFAAAGTGPLAVLVNNAGITGHAPIDEVTPETYDRVMAVNTRGAFFTLQAAARRMSAGGRIVNVSSTSTAWPSPGEAVYAASKAALEQLTRVASRELGPRGITVNTVPPGVTDTDLLHTGAPPEMIITVAHMTALARIGQPDDIARIVALLAGPDSAWLTGQNLRADGGLV